MSESRSFELILVDEGAKARLYAVRFRDREQDELDAFLRREEGRRCSAAEKAACRERSCRSKCRRSEFFNKIAENLDLSVQEYGFDTRFFSLHTNYPYPTGAFAFGTYRLYGLRYGPDLFIAGGGGIKLVRNLADDPVLFGHYRDIQYVSEQVSLRVNRHYGGDLPRRPDGRRYLSGDLLSY